VTDDEIVLALDAAGWTLETSPRSGWIVLRRGSHIFAGPDLRGVANRIQRLERQSEPEKELQGKRQEET
jgi:hypothetical protein